MTAASQAQSFAHFIPTESDLCPIAAPLDADLPDSPPGNDAPTPWDDPIFVGCVLAHQRGVAGEITLEVLLSPDGQSLEIGPFRLARREAVALYRLLSVARELLAHGETRPAAEAGRGITGWDLSRNPTGRATCPPWEGETLP